MHKPQNTESFWKRTLLRISLRDTWSWILSQDANKNLKKILFYFIASHLQWKNRPLKSNSFRFVSNVRYCISSNKHRTSNNLHLLTSTALALYVWAQSFLDLVFQLEIARKNALDWFKLNKMIVNPENLRLSYQTRENLILRICN